jgi:hypothetical protein
MGNEVAEFLEEFEQVQSEAYGPYRKKKVEKVSILPELLRAIRSLDPHPFVRRF